MEIQRKIVESYNPPSNREVWWFDLNDKIIKRYKQGKWVVTLTQKSDENKPIHAIVKYSTSDKLPITGTGSILDSTSEIIFPTTDIPESALSHKNTLYQVVITDTIEIGVTAFYDCTSLTSVTIGNSVTTIRGSAFDSCTSLTSITIGNSVTSIGDYAFEYCSSLTSVTIPDSVTSIGDYAFYNCTSLKTIYCKSIIPPTLGSLAISDTIDAIYVPIKSLDAYKNATNWSDYRDQIVGYNF